MQMLGEGGGGVSCNGMKDVLAPRERVKVDSFLLFIVSCMSFFSQEKRSDFKSLQL